MGWASGSELCSNIICLIEDAHIPEYAKLGTYINLFRLFLQEDCDNLHETLVDWEDTYLYPILEEALEKASEASNE